MNRATNLSAIGTALVLAVGACGGSDPAPAAVAPTPVATTASPTPTPSPSASTAAPLSVGDSATFHGGQVTTTVISYRQPAGGSGIPKPDRAGDTWGSVEVKVCTKPDAELINVSTVPWVLAYDDGAVLEPSGVSYRQLPQPRYPWSDHPVRPGRCVRGWITYEVPAKSRPAYIQYQPASGEPTEWKVG